MTAILPIRKAASRGEAGDHGWRWHLGALGLVSAAILLLLHRDVMGLVEVWLSRSTYNHCALILPIIGWLVWQRWQELRRLTPSAWTPGRVLVGAGAFRGLLDRKTVVWGWCVSRSGDIGRGRLIKKNS